MMPTCSCKNCKKVSEVKVALVWDEDCNQFANSLYLCLKHAKKFAKRYGVKNRVF